MWIKTLSLILSQKDINEWQIHSNANDNDNAKEAVEEKNIYFRKCFKE